MTASQFFSLRELAKRSAESVSVWRKRVLLKQIPFYKLVWRVRTSNDYHCGAVSYNREGQRNSRSSTRQFESRTAAAFGATVPCSVLVPVLLGKPPELNPARPF